MGSIDKEIIFPQRFPSLIVKKNSAAWTALLRICRAKVEPGMIYTVSEEEFSSLQNDVIAMDVPEE